jgi:DNA polymerase (family 10)
MVWTAEARELAAQGRPLTDLPRVGPWIAHHIQGWLDSPPEIPDPPASRSGFMAMSEARQLIRSHPGWRDGLVADLQMHTQETDGASTIEEMATAAAALGHEAIAITDHSKTLKITRGMDEARLLAQGRAIDGLNARLAQEGARLRVLKGIEMDLTPEGAGDMDRDALGTLDVVLGAFHSQLRLSIDQTERYLRALDNPDIHVLAHPRTRMWNKRNGLIADWPRVGERAAERGIALEIDGSPDRQDLDAATLEQVAGIPDLWFAIDTDAHHPDELSFIDLGVGAAIKAGVRRDRILNFLPVDRLVEWLRERSGRARS